MKEIFGKAPVPGSDIDFQQEDLLSRSLFFHRMLVPSEEGKNGRNSQNYLRRFLHSPLFSLDGRGTLETGTIRSDGVQLIVCVPPSDRSSFIESARQTDFEDWTDPQDRFVALKQSVPRQLVSQASEWLGEMIQRGRLSGLNKRLIMPHEVKYLPNEFILGAIEVFKSEAYLGQRFPLEYDILPFKPWIGLTKNVLTRAIEWYKNRLRWRPGKQMELPTYGIIPRTPDKSNIVVPGRHFD